MTWNMSAVRFCPRAWQGEAFAAEMVDAGAAQALIPLLDPKFELIRIEGLVRKGGEREMRYVAFGRGGKGKGANLRRLGQHANKLAF